MGDTTKISHVKAGDALKIRASDWNAIADAVNKGFPTPSQTEKKLRDYMRRSVVIENASFSEMSFGNVIKLKCDFLNENQPGYLSMPAFLAEIPSENDTNGVFAVVSSKTIAAGEQGLAIVCGPAVCELNTATSDGGWAVPDGNGKLKLTNSQSGLLQILPAQTIQARHYAIIGSSKGSIEQEKEGQFDLRITVSGGVCTAKITNTSGQQPQSKAGYVKAGSMTFQPVTFTYVLGGEETARYFYCETEYTPDSGQGWYGTWRCEITSYAAEQIFSGREKLYWVLLGVVIKQQSGEYIVSSKREPGLIEILGRVVP